jgi:hypothetical protein
MASERNSNTANQLNMTSKILFCFRMKLRGFHGEPWMAACNLTQVLTPVSCKMEHSSAFCLLIQVTPCDSLPWNVTSRSASQEIISLWWSPKVHYRAQRNPALDSILSQLSPVHTLTSISINTHSNIILLSITSSPFHKDFPTTPFSVIYLPHECYMPRPSHPPLFDRPNIIWRM